MMMTETVTIFGFATNSEEMKKCPRIKDQPGKSRKNNKKIILYGKNCLVSVFELLQFPIDTIAILVS